ncbi:MAG: Mut7-C RNAse domain-containing protein [Candidatus Omnitrophica bacterium]|nr:Mut7-C RNAse domain-containing protein [Candidatus Omnitrophota bacterium]
MTFVADGMLGNAAKWLRLAGYDALYFNTRRKSELVRIARRDGRILLTRDRKLFEENEGIAVFIESEGTSRQLREIKNKLLLEINPMMFFTRCSLCNSPLERKEKYDITALVPEYVYANRDKFSQCPECRRVYWDGDHCKAIRDALNELGEG